MDFLNQGYARLVDLFKSMTPGARITAGLLLSMVVISLAYLVNHASTGQETLLMGGEPFSAAQLPSMEAAFSKAGLNDYKIEGNRIRVPFGKQASYMGALADGGALPADFGKILEKAVATSPWVSKVQRAEAMKIAKQIELQSIICHMQGIESASVMYDVEAPKSFGQDKVATASVNVKPQGSTQLDENQVRNCRNLVAGAIAGMKPQNVTVTDLNGKSYPGSSSADGLGGGDDDPYLTRKRNYEKQWAEKIASALSYIPGVLVTSDVELDAETMHEESSTDFDPKTVPFQQREEALTKTVRGPGGGGRPGPAQQHGVNQPATVSTAGSAENTEENTQTETQNAVSTKSRRVVHSPLTPKRVKVAVSIPSSYYEKVWLERNPAPPGQDAKKPDVNALNEIESKVKTDVQSAVVALLPTVSTTADPLPRVQVTSFQHLPGALLPAATPADKALAWAGQYWSTLGLMGLALMSMVMLRSMVRGAPSAANPSSSFNVVQSPDETMDAAEPASREAEPQNIRNRLKRRPPGGPSLRDELSELVKEDPDAAVTVLRSWIGNASEAMKNRHQALRKAAVLIASLDRAMADALLAQMTAEQARAVGEAIQSLGDVEPHEQQAVIEEFFRIGPLMPEKSPPGIELDSSSALHLGTRMASAGATSSAAERSGRAGHEPSPDPTAPPFRCLEETSSGALSRYLQREHPQTIAVVISHLTSDRAAEVLALLPAQLQGEVTLRLVHLDKTDPEILDEIERGMQTWIWQQSRSTRAPVAGLEMLRGILAAADAGAKNTILRNLAQRDRRLASKLTSAPRRNITFADLEQLGDPALANVLRHAPSEIVLLALAGARQEFLERVVRLIPAEDAHLLRRGLDNLGPTRLSDVERAQQELADVARQFDPAALDGRDEKKHLSVAV